MEQHVEYRKQNNFEKLNKDIQSIYNTVASRFVDKSVNGNLIRRLTLHYVDNKHIFQFWSSVHKQTCLLNEHTTQYIWLLPPKFVCINCNNKTSLQKLRQTEIVTETGVYNGIEVQTTCKRGDCSFKDKTVRFNGWVDNEKQISYFPSHISGSNRSNVFARSLNRYVCKQNTQIIKNKK